MSIKEAIRNRLMEVHKQCGINYQEYSNDWQEYVEDMTWKSMCAVVAAKGVSLNEAMQIILP